jgi:hypothetical protein
MRSPQLVASFVLKPRYKRPWPCPLAAFMEGIAHPGRHLPAFLGMESSFGGLFIPNLISSVSCWPLAATPVGDSGRSFRG